MMSWPRRVDVGFEMVSQRGVEDIVGDPKSKWIETEKESTSLCYPIDIAKKKKDDPSVKKGYLTQSHHPAPPL